MFVLSSKEVSIRRYNDPVPIAEKKDHLHAAATVLALSSFTSTSSTIRAKLSAAVHSYSFVAKALPAGSAMFLGFNSSSSSSTNIGLPGSARSRRGELWRGFPRDFLAATGKAGACSDLQMVMLDARCPTGCSDSSAG